MKETDTLLKHDWNELYANGTALLMYCSINYKIIVTVHSCISYTLLKSNQCILNKKNLAYLNVDSQYTQKCWINSSIVIDLKMKYSCSACLFPKRGRPSKYGSTHGYTKSWIIYFNISHLHITKLIEILIHFAMISFQFKFMMHRRCWGIW